MRRLSRIRRPLLVLIALVLLLAVGYIANAVKHDSKSPHQLPPPLVRVAAGGEAVGTVGAHS